MLSVIPISIKLKKRNGETNQHISGFLLFASNIISNPVNIKVIQLINIAGE